MLQKQKRILLIILINEISVNKSGHDQANDYTVMMIKVRIGIVL